MKHGVRSKVEFTSDFVLQTFYPYIAIMKNHFELTLKVRDYECDLQGIVNNSVYQQYMEHTRHEFISEMGLDFAALHREGTDLVVARLEMAFKTPLTSGDEALITLNVTRDGIKYIFDQKIYRKSDMKLALTGKVTTVSLINGKLGIHPVVDETLVAFLNKQ